MKVNQIFSIEHIDARRMILVSDGKFEIKNENILINDYPVINTEKFNVKIKDYTTKYIPNRVYLKDDKLYLEEFKLNDATLFLLPLLFKDKNNSLFDHNLINLYLYIDKSEVFTNQIYLTFRYTPFEYYTEFIEKLKKLNASELKFNYLEKDKDSRFDILCFTIKNAPILNTIRLFLKGKFIKFPKLHKKRIIAFNNDMNITGMLLNEDSYRKRFESRYGFEEGELDGSLSLRTISPKEDLTWLN